jgi:GR25 family glycosyltransferase involved in LPS biosynthesis
MAEKVPAFIINLVSDVDRRAAVLRQFEGLTQFNPVIVSGILGRTLPEVACRALVHHIEWSRQRGTIGCFLSHAKAWEQVAGLPGRFGVVLEDDVDVAHLAAVCSWDLPTEAEIVFLNDRMAATSTPAKSPVIAPLSEGLRRLNDTRSGPGGDGYLLTPQGARKLVEACRRDLFFGHVDGRLLRYATSDEDLAALKGTWLHNVIGNHHHPTLIPELGLLRGFTSSNPVISHKGVASSREAEDTLVVANG